ncbi:MAG: glutaredoxin domain-containing protein [Acidobacteriota bacterium]
MTVSVYVAAGCPFCRVLLEDFRRRGVAHVVIDLSREPHRLAELAAVTWERRVPAIVDHERCSIGSSGASTALEDLGIR